MADVVEICNIALSNIGGGSINSLNEKSLQAQQCKLKYPFMRDQVLVDAPWQFAHKVKPLAVLTNEDPFNWVFAYQYPSDCLHINRLMLNLEEVSQDSLGLISRYRDPSLVRLNLDQQVKYEIQNSDDNKIIVANESELRVDYRAKVTDPNLFSPQMILALSYLMASELAMPVIRGKEGRALRIESLQIYQQYLDAAISSDLNEQYHPPEDSEYITARS